MNRTLWFARHEFRLAWRDFIGMITAGKPRRGRIAIALVLAFAAFMHLTAWKMVGRYADITFPPDRETLIAVTGSALLACTVMISQAMESVTRAFYSRADLDLLMSSPAPTRPIFMLRTAARALRLLSLRWC
jgi:ABC-2 type transport system permease protein